jgi:hypothetical protein
MFIYIIVNQENGKIYIGKTTTSDLSAYLKRKFYDSRNYKGSSYLFNAMNKYPPYVWAIYPLISTLTTDEDLCFWERVLIAQYDSQNPNIGYNICRGGEGHTGPHSKEWKQKMSVIMKAKGHKPTVKATADSVRVRRQIHKQSGRWPGAQLNDMTGTTINGVSVLKQLESTKDGDAMWACLCECGKPFNALGGSLRSGHTRSCGCLKAEQDRTNLSFGSGVKDITGTVINGIEVLSRVGSLKRKDGRCRDTTWSCRCRCGNIFVVRGYYLRNGHTKSCGCLHRKPLII